MARSGMAWQVRLFQEGFRTLMFIVLLSIVLLGGVAVRIRTIGYGLQRRLEFVFKGSGFYEDCN